MAKTIDLEKILSKLGPEFAEKSAELEESDTFVSENYDALRERKLFSALIPASFGGGGASHAAMCAFLRGLAHHCPSTALALSMHQHLVAAAVANDMAGRPGKALLEKVAGGELILVSTGANDWLDSNGVAEKVDGGFKITAVKPFASGSPKGNVAVTSVPYDDPVEGPQVLHFPVPLNADGVSLLGDWQTLGMRATGSQSIKFDGVFVPEGAVALRRPRGPFHPAFAVILTVAMPLIMSVYVGVAEAAAGIARTGARKRTGDPVMPYLLGEMEGTLTTAQVMCDDMIRLANGFSFTPSAELASEILTRKSTVARNVLATAEKALEIAGGAGFYRRNGLERLLRDAHASQFHPLPEKRQQLFTGRLALGLEPVEAPAVQTRKKAA